MVSVSMHMAPRLGISKARPESEDGGVTRGSVWHGGVFSVPWH